MFEILDSLTYQDVIKVSHGIFAMWDTYDGVASNLRPDLKDIACKLATQYGEDKYYFQLVKYVKERSNHEIREDNGNAQRFLDSI